MKYFACLLLMVAVTYCDNGVLKFKLTPKDAKVYINGKLKGSASNVSLLEAKPGAYVIRLQKGSQSKRKKYTVQSNKVTNVKMSLGSKKNKSVIKPIKSSYGYIQIDTIPQGIDVFVSGQFVGKSPVKQVKVMSGVHKLDFKDSNKLYKDYTQNIKVKKFDQRKLKFYMLPGRAKLFMVGEGKGRVLINGTLSNDTVPGVVNVPTGDVFIEIEGDKKGYNHHFNLKNDQEFEVKYILTPDKQIDIKNDTLKSMNMIKIPAGAFYMGANKGERFRGKDETPQHKVTISKPFLMGKYEVTQKQFKMVMGYNPSPIKADNLPVDNVSWLDAQRFIIRLNTRVGCKYPDTLQSIDKYGINAVAKGCFRLPTEAEWEYAARAGTKTIFHFGDSLGAAQANFHTIYPYGNAIAVERKNKAFKVGSFMPNKFGLYDMHGNVWEWCHDWYDEDSYVKSFYRGSANKDPVNTKKAYKRVIRGGGFGTNGKYLRSANRDKNRDKTRSTSYGFRLVAVE
ncbi:MAG: SUMF1/EgtB/PvdO family nonheme iron enzyme [Candidatus Cloacimonetes bacterium]|nr:SUMF1/EgtB/PvdO family nonheme iron enzyme [Candidatus Cloacimonadota bacterium]